MPYINFDIIKKFRFFFNFPRLAIFITQLCAASCRFIYAIPPDAALLAAFTVLSNDENDSVRDVRGERATSSRVQKCVCPISIKKKTLDRPPWPRRSRKLVSNPDSIHLSKSDIPLNAVKMAQKLVSWENFLYQILKFRKRFFGKKLV